MTERDRHDTHAPFSKEEVALDWVSSCSLGRAGRWRPNCSAGGSARCVAGKRRLRVLDLPGPEG